MANILLTVVLVVCLIRAVGFWGFLCGLVLLALINAANKK